MKINVTCSCNTSFEPDLVSVPPEGIVCPNCGKILSPDTVSRLLSSASLLAAAEPE